MQLLFERFFYLLIIHLFHLLFRGVLSTLSRVFGEKNLVYIYTGNLCNFTSLLYRRKVWIFLDFSVCSTVYTEQIGHLLLRYATQQTRLFDCERFVHPLSIV